MDKDKKLRVAHEQCWSKFSNACMLQQTDASSKPFGDMKSNMGDDPDSKGA